MTAIKQVCCCGCKSTSTAGSAPV